MKTRHVRTALAALALSHGTVVATASTWSGPWSDPTKPDAAIPGFIGPHGEGKARDFIGRDPETGEHLYAPTGNPGNRVNPVFFGWAATVEDYSPVPGVVSAEWQDAGTALGPVTAAWDDVVSLGDLSAGRQQAGEQPGSIVVGLSAPVSNLPGADLVVFENNFVVSGFTNNVPADLAFVEVSSDGAHFARFPSRSTTSDPVSQYGSIDARAVFNLAGKHGNHYFAGQSSWGTPFDLSQLAEDPLVLNGSVDTNDIRFVRIVDIPGNGTSRDSTGSPIYDPFETIGSGGFDLEAVGAISVSCSYAEWAALKKLPPEKSAPAADPDGDGLSNIMEAAIGREPLFAEFSPVGQLKLEDGMAEFTFPRDTRPNDLAIEVQTSTNLESWETIARSVRGGALAVVAPHAPELSETSASHIASLGVIRSHKVRTVLSSSGRTWFRLAVSSAPAE